jgi:hypothetical protein
MNNENEYKIAYEHQMMRNKNLVQRVRNLQSELMHQKSAFARLLNAVDTPLGGLTGDESKWVRSWLIEFAVEMGFLLNPTGKKYAIRNLAAGYTADGGRELDPDNDREMQLQEAANHLDRLWTYFDID